MHTIEQELIKATGYKVQRKFDNRQDYLKSLFLAVQNLDDDDFNELSDEAAEWANACVEAHNSTKDGDLPDFDEIDDEGEAEADDDASDGDEDPDQETSGDAEEGEPEEELVEEEPKPKKKAKAPVADKRIPKPEKKKPAKEVPTRPRPKEGEDVSLDKWGCIVGSKNHQALALFEKGATSAEIKAKLGGTYYNILGKMTSNGHKVLKEGSVITLVHKDAVSSPKKSKQK